MSCAVVMIATLAAEEAKEIMKRPYTYCLIREAGSGIWTGTIKEFPGCIAQDNGYDIIESLYSTALDWIAAAQDLGQKIPEPEVQEREQEPEETCPGCGAPIRVVEGKGTDYETIVYVCGTGEDSGYFGRECWANQCMQARERIEELEEYIRGFKQKGLV